MKTKSATLFSRCIKCFLVLAVFVSGPALANETVNIPIGYSFIGCYIHGTNGNHLNDFTGPPSNPSFLVVPDFFSDPNGVQNSIIGIWNCSGFKYYIYYSANDFPYPEFPPYPPPPYFGWFDSTGAATHENWNAGQGMIWINPEPGSASITFYGTPQTPVLPPTNFCGCGAWSLLSSQTTNATATYEEITGFAPQEGAQVAFDFKQDYLNGTGNYTYSNGVWSPSLPFQTVNTFSNGMAWTPGAPLVTIGHAAFFFVPVIPGPSIQFTNIEVAGGNILLQWHGSTNATLYLQRTATFAGTNTAWTDIWTGTPPTSFSGSYTDQVGTNALQFYRIKAVP